MLIKLKPTKLKQNTKITTKILMKLSTKVIINKDANTNDKSSDIGNDLPWHTTPIPDALEALRCISSHGNFIDHGLSLEESHSRLEQFGLNQLSQKESPSLLKKIYHHLANVLVGILLFVAIVSAVRAATASDNDTILTNAIQVGLIVFVIT